MNQIFICFILRSSFVFLLIIVDEIISSLKLLLDKNKNGQWDTGAYYGKKKQQPEIVTIFTTPLNIRANWDNEITLTLNK